MQNMRTVAFGRAARAVLQFMNHRPVDAADLRVSPRISTGSAPKSTLALRIECELLIAPAVGEWLAAGGPVGDYIRADDGAVQRALDLAQHIGAAAAIDNLQPVIEGVVSTLSAPNVWGAVGEAAKALLRSPRWKLDGQQLARAIGGALGASRHDIAPAAPLRRIYAGELMR
jgi:hypothetical protein